MEALSPEHLTKPWEASQLVASKLPLWKHREKWPLNLLLGVIMEIRPRRLGCFSGWNGLLGRRQNAPMCRDSQQEQRGLRMKWMDTK